MRDDTQLILDAEEAIDIYYTKEDMASEIKEVFSAEEVSRLLSLAETQRNRMSECLWIVLKLFM